MAVPFAPNNGSYSDDERNQPKRVYARIPETWIQRLAMKVICSGETPKHVAFIMDGNRRYAKEHGLADVTEGHRLGEKAMQLVSSFIETTFTNALLPIFVSTDDGQMF